MASSQTKTSLAEVAHWRKTYQRTPVARAMKPSLIVVSLLIALAVLHVGCDSVRSQSYCVRAGATGAGNGLDWHNAFPALPATLQRGATYYVAAGTYASYRFDDPVAGTNVITIKKATASDHKTNTGWVSTYGKDQVVWNGPLHFDTSYWVFDGQGRNESNWFDGGAYGFKIFHNKEDQQIRMGVLGTAVTHIELKHVYLQALNGGLSSTVTGRRYGLDIDTFGGTGTFRNLVVNRCFFQYGNVPIFTRNNEAMVVEYSAFDANESNAANHGEAMSAYYTNHRFIIRHNKFRAIHGTAVIAFTTGSPTPVDGFEIYGNIVWNCNLGDGVFGFDRQEWPFSNTKIYNNTIVRKAGGVNSGIAIRSGANNEVYNNLWVNCEANFWNGPGANYSHNAYSWNWTEPNAQVNVLTSLFINYEQDDFRLAAPTGAGSLLEATYKTDILGATRGNDGNWDRGAFEFQN
jgi:hypothetical protein